MRIVFKLLKWLFGALVAAIIAFLIAIRVAPPELLQVGDSYAAKIACSNVFLAGRDAQKVLADDVQAPGNPILKAVMLDVDKDKGKVTARLLGYAASRSSVYRPGYGCTNLADEAITPAALPAPPQPTVPDANAEWPVGNHAGASFDPALAGILSDDTLRGPGMRAIVVVHHGKIVAETYGAGFDDKTPLIGWSMTKTVNAILAGRAAQLGLLSFDDKNLFPDWVIADGPWVKVYPGIPGYLDANWVAQAVAALQCPETKSMLASVRAPMTLHRFVSNFLHSFTFTGYRIDRVPLYELARCGLPIPEPGLPPPRE